MSKAFPSSRAPLDPSEIYHRIHGDGPGLPVVLLHGLMGFSANWGKIWPSLATTRRVLVLDQVGHGRSAHRPSGYGPGDYATDLAELLNFLGWEKIHVVGHSMGGRVALAFAYNYPQRTQSLSLEDSGLESIPSRVQWIEGLLNGIPTPFESRESAKKFFAEKYPAPSMLGSFLFSNLVELADGRQDWRFCKAGMRETIVEGRAKDAMEPFTELSLPTLLIRGGDSQEFPQAEAERMQGARKNVNLETIPGAGHFVHAEKPEPFGQILAAFLDKNDL